MKKLLFLIIVAFIILPSVSKPQIIFYSKIDSIVNLVSTASISKFNRQLSGDTIAVIGGSPYRIISRKYNSPHNPKAAQYIFETFQSFGYTPYYQYNNSTNINVIARKIGSKYPNQKYLITAHYDNYSTNSTDTVPGADDNASGTAAVLEAARLLAGITPQYTIEFIAFDEEEIGLYGSRAYVDSAFARGDSILGVLNMDMIAWDGNDDGKLNVYLNTASNSIAEEFIKAVQIYNINLTSVKSYNSGGSDHYYFWQRGYKAITLIELGSDFNPYYHTRQDTYDKFNLNYFTKITKAAIATFLSWALDYKYSINHTPIKSGMDTSSKVVVAEIHFPIPIATGSNAPRLYYKINNNSYQFVNAFEIVGKTYKFLIPGQPQGTKVSYYIAAQDSAGSIIATLPDGGSGINPPGTVPPPNPFVYNIWVGLTANSITVPKPIPDLNQVKDTIFISQNGTVEDITVTLNITHPDDGEIVVFLNKANASSTLTQYNGVGGQNYINTVFDDSATISIKQGFPPFTGTYKPETPLYNFRGQELQGYWILRIYDKAIGNQGTLNNWSLNISYSINVAVKGQSGFVPDKYFLFQNYPNPFNPTTTIKFHLPKSDFVKLIIYDILGREIEVLVNEFKSAGEYIVLYNASSLPSGLYFYRIITSEFNDVRKFVLIK
ncbi:MAG: M20/M25/M40 family metallo-hydrolase [Ignavibacteria bacterium]|nr:M20/M25/M40 family metallo-hydrolase [Ignavibacteria bacterium]